MSIPKRLIDLTIISTIAFGLVSCGKWGVRAAGENSDLTQQQVVSLDDQKFLFKAEDTEVRQLTMAQEVLQKSRNDQVREFAKRVVEDRTQALAGLKRLMADKHVQETPGRAEEIQLEAANRLRDISADALDHEFVSLMAAEQQEAVANFDSAAQSSPDLDIRSYAERTSLSLTTDYVTAVDLEMKLRQGSTLR